MAIEIQYQPSAAVIGGAGYAGGEAQAGQFADQMDLRSAQLRLQNLMQLRQIAAQRDAQQQQLQARQAQQQQQMQARAQQEAQQQAFNLQRDFQQQQGRLGYMREQQGLIGQNRLGEQQAGFDNQLQVGNLQETRAQRDQIRAALPNQIDMEALGQKDPELAQQINNELDGMWKADKELRSGGLGVEQYNGRMSDHFGALQDLTGAVGDKAKPGPKQNVDVMRGTNGQPILDSNGNERIILRSDQKEPDDVLTTNKIRLEGFKADSKRAEELAKAPQKFEENEVKRRDSAWKDYSNYKKRREDAVKELQERLDPENPALKAPLQITPENLAKVGFTQADQQAMDGALAAYGERRQYQGQESRLEEAGRRFDEEIQRTAGAEALPQGAPPQPPQQPPLQPDAPPTEQAPGTAPPQQQLPGLGAPGYEQPPAPQPPTQEDWSNSREQRLSEIRKRVREAGPPSEGISWFDAPQVLSYGAEAVAKFYGGQWQADTKGAPDQKPAATPEPVALSPGQEASAAKRFPDAIDPVGTMRYQKRLERTWAGVAKRFKSPTKEDKTYGNKMPDVSYEEFNSNVMDYEIDDPERRGPAVGVTRKEYDKWVDQAKNPDKYEKGPFNAVLWDMAKRKLASEFGGIDPKFKPSMLTKRETYQLLRMKDDLKALYGASLYAHQNKFGEDREQEVRNAARATVAKAISYFLGDKFTPTKRIDGGSGWDITTPDRVTGLSDLILGETPEGMKMLAKQREAVQNISPTGVTLDFEDM